MVSFNSRFNWSQQNVFKALLVIVVRKIRIDHRCRPKEKKSNENNFELDIVVEIL